MGFGNFFGSESKSQESNAAADNQSVVLTGKASNYTGSGSVNLSGSAGTSYVSPGGVNVQGSNLTDSGNKGLAIGANATTGNIILNDTSGYESLVDKFTGSLKSLGDTFSNAFKSGEPVVSDSGSDRSVTLSTAQKWYYGIAIIAGLLTIAFYLRKRKKA